jgi:hypothetical protein
MVTNIKFFEWRAHANFIYGKANYFFQKYFQYFEFGHLFLSILRILIYFLRFLFQRIDYFHYLT